MFPDFKHFFSLLTHEQFTFQAEVLEFVAFGVCHVCGPFPGVLGRDFEVGLPAAGDGRLAGVVVAVALTFRAKEK